MIRSRFFGSTMTVTVDPGVILSLYSGRISYSIRPEYESEPGTVRWSASLANSPSTVRRRGCDGVDSCPPFEAVLFEFALGAGRAVGPCHSESENRAESGEQPADLIGQRARRSVLDQPSEPHGEHDQIPHRDETHGVYDATVIHQISSTSRIA